MKFLKARWQHLLFANYIVNPNVLARFVPAGTRIDAFEGQVFVSLVAFMFTDTRILGVPVPFHINFEEVNLRFYISPINDPSKRAVTFIKEIVPRRAIPLIANSLFFENYIALPMAHENRSNYHFYSWRSPEENSISGNISSPLSYPSSNSVTEFITEHYWGYAKGSRCTLEYQVEHPQWRCSEITDYTIAVDFESNYGREFSFLGNTKPYNVLYAEGSEVSVSFPRVLTHRAT